MKQLVKKHQFFVYIIALCFAGCSKEIIITPEYIINKNWNYTYTEHLYVCKMQLLPDSILDLNNITQTQLLNKLVEDTLQDYDIQVTSNMVGYKQQQVFFNKFNGEYWGRTNQHFVHPSIKTIGVLQKGCWYRFAGLVYHGYSLYIYIDENYTAHRFDVNQSNW